MDCEGVKWERLFSVPQTVISPLSKLDPKDPKAFVKATGERKGKIGDLYQLSAELSEKRTKEMGKDFVKAKSWDNYEKKRVKSVHPERRKEQLKEFIKKNKNFDIEM